MRECTFQPRHVGHFLAVLHLSDSLTCHHVYFRYRDGGYRQMINTDLSNVVIKQQAEFFPEQTWKVMDAMKLEYDDKSFPVIIDKSLIDTLLCASQRYV